LKKEGLSQGAIARNLEVNKSTISREIRRNTGLKVRIGFKKESKIDR
jgi:IS30 family transposase